MEDIFWLRLGLMLAWCCFFTLLQTFSGSISNLFCKNAVREFQANVAERQKKKPPSYTASQYLNWNTRVASQAHALIVTPLSVLAVIGVGASEEAGWDQNFVSRMESTYWLSDLVMSCGTGYFLWDSLLCIKYPSMGISFLLHGIFAFVAYACALLFPVTHYYGCLFLMFEASTPFVNMYWWSSRSKGSLGSVRLWSAMVLIVWCIFRFYMGWFYGFTQASESLAYGGYYTVQQWWGYDESLNAYTSFFTEKTQSPVLAKFEAPTGTMRTHAVSFIVQPSCVLLSLLNLIWFAAIVPMMVRTWRDTKSKPKSS